MKILLGKVKKDAGTYADGEFLWLEKHKWECERYWAFGYLRNKNCHFHFDSLFTILQPQASEFFDETDISDSDWWVIRDLFVQAYALKKAAEVYRYGGHQTSRPGVTDLIRDDEMVKRLNSDLERILDKLWNFIVEAKRES